EKIRYQAPHSRISGNDSGTGQGVHYPVLQNSFNITHDQHYESSPCLTTFASFHHLHARDFIRPLASPNDQPNESFPGKMTHQ
ncbi:hypothetical protein HAX54_050543, partial [Datura stramonium]|nr:hypothetical protein [Datura stramonium]